MKTYDILVVGAGLSASIVAYEASKRGLSVLVIDRRSHIGGNCYQEDINGIQVHKYGAHIFRTNDEDVWNYINQFVHFNNFINSPLARYKNKLFNLPFNMNTFYQIYNTKTPEEAIKKIEKDRLKVENPKNLEEYAKKLVGKKIYKLLIKDYTEKQWGKKCKDLPVSIMRRIPLRFTFNNNYYDSKYQGVPIEGYNALFEKLLSKCDVLLSTSYEDIKDKVKANKIVYTGAIDELYNYKYGELEWRSLEFETYVLKQKDFQGNAVVNYTDKRPYTRIIEHKHFVGNNCDETVITYEYPKKWTRYDEKYYPINDEKNEKLYNKYRKLANKEGIILCGRLADYKYYDMQDTIINALRICKEYLK